MNITTQDIILFLTILWAVAATCYAIAYRYVAIHHRQQFLDLMRLSFHLTKHEDIRKDFEHAVVDRILNANKEQANGSV
jgi:hypothetical protein